MLAAALLCADGLSASSTPQLESAHVRVVMISPTACDVVLRLRVTGALEVEHRLATPRGTQVEQFGVEGGRLAAEVRAVGQTRSARVLPDESGSSYTLTYRVALPEQQAYRCPLWLPAAPADGRSRAVRVEVRLPAGAAIRRGTLPALRWDGLVGTATLGHLPSAVHVPYAPVPGGGPNLGLDIARAMDATAVLAFLGATLFWLWRRKG